MSRVAEDKTMRTRLDQPVEFITKLYQMLSDTSLQDVVSWSPSQTSFLIHDVSRFQQEIIPQVFKHSNFASFVRQLNKYGFHKVKARPNMPSNLWEFEHPDFRPENSHDLTLIRRKQKSAPSAAASVRESVDGVQQSVANILTRLERVELENQHLRDTVQAQGIAINRLLAESNQHSRRWMEELDNSARVDSPMGVVQDGSLSTRTLRPVALAMDDPSARDICSRLLRKFGLAVTSVSNGQDLLKLVETGGPFQYVIMDLVLEGVDGLYATQLLRARNIITPIILILDEGRYHLAVEEYVQHGASAVLIRPFTKVTLFDTLTSLAPRVC